jgi:hypothetical protein
MLEAANEIFVTEDVGTEATATQNIQPAQDLQPTGIADHPFLIERWDIISQGLDQVWLRPDHRDAKLYMKIYQARWDFCTNDLRESRRQPPAKTHSDRLSALYRRLIEYLRNKLSEVRTRVIDKSTTDKEVGLELYLYEWQHYKQFAKQVDHVFTVYGGWHTAQKSELNWGRTPSVWSLHLAQWKEAFFITSYAADGRMVSQIAEEYSKQEQADDPSLIIQPFQEIAALLERGPWGPSKESFDPEKVDYSVLCPVHKGKTATERQEADQQDVAS